MLRRTENVQVFLKVTLWGRLTGGHRILLVAGRQRYLSPGKFNRSGFQAMEQRSAVTPVAYLRAGDRTYWRFAGRWHTDNEGLSQEAVHALLVTRAMRQDDQVKRAMTIASQGRLATPPLRGSISNDVKQLVWNRDRGACRACGSTAELQFDHVIPVARGGGSTEHNLQVLCGPCNRRKGASI
jgi:5-methylcytosine-specific restriction endonuclease McrA